VRTSEVNSRNTPLGAGEVWTSDGEFGPYTHAAVYWKTDADGYISVQVSSDDGENWDSGLSYQVKSGVPGYHILQKNNRKVRVVFTNGDVAQTYLRLVLDYGDYIQGTSPLNLSLSNDADAILVKNISEETLIAEGLFADRFIVNKFGFNADVDAAEDLCSIGADYTGFPVSSFGTVNFWSSTLADNGAVIEVFGLDDDFDLQLASYTLTGTTTSAELWSRINRVRFKTPASGYETNVGELRADLTTGAYTLAQVPAGYGITQQCVYTIPRGYTGYIIREGLSMFDNSTISAEVVLWIRRPDGAVTLEYEKVVRNTARVDVEYFGGIEVPEKTDIKLRVLSVANTNAKITGSFDIKLVRNI